LRDQECWFGFFACQQAFWESRDEDHRHLEFEEYLVDGIYAGAAIGQLDICEYQPWALDRGKLYCFLFSARHSGYPMANTFQKRFQIHGDDRLILDYQYIGSDL